MPGMYLNGAEVVPSHKLTPQKTCQIKYVTYLNDRFSFCVTLMV